MSNVFDDLDFIENSWNYENEDKICESKIHNPQNNLIDEDEDYFELGKLHISLLKIIIITHS